MHRIWASITASLVALSITASAQQPTLSPTEASCRVFVQGFYDWYLPRASRSADAYPAVLKSKAQLFSPTLVQALKQDYAASKANPNEVVGLDFDPFLNSQDPSTKFSVSRVKVTGTKCSTEVHGITDGVNNEEVHPELSFVNGNWQFVNFRYEQGSDLLSMLKSLKAERQKADGQGAR
ncbi:MAG TPA: hypothetical protein VMU28_11090 [Terriglobales bacterium]|nr:hypothetical protein [Terriglobales bacterium]